MADTERSEVRASRAWFKEVDEWAAKQPAPPKRGAAIKALADIGLKQVNKGKK